MHLSGMRIAELRLVERICTGIRSRQAFECGNSAHTMEVLPSPLAHSSTEVGLEWSENMLHKKETRRDALEIAVKDLADVVRSLQQLLQGYGPLWFTSEIDARLRDAIAEADSALRPSGIQRRQYPDARREAAKEATQAA